MQDAINNLKTNNSSGPDETTLSYVKISAPILIPELNRIFNLSLSSIVQYTSISFSTNFLNKAIFNNMKIYVFVKSYIIS